MYETKPYLPHRTLKPSTNEDHANSITLQNIKAFRNNNEANSPTLYNRFEYIFWNHCNGKISPKLCKIAAGSACFVLVIIIISPIAWLLRENYK